MTNKVKRAVKPGSVVCVELPYSEVCMHMGISGMKMDILVLSFGVQILNNSGDNYSAPVTHGEAGVYGTLLDGMYVYVTDETPETDNLAEADKVLNR